mmetsp:Transcript_10354/g.18885  ORF Transcript_10354/g.18885 Transcript_10354/m.18885 type:complete len:569 (+) Transcript_10354:964-2670(+)
MPHEGESRHDVFPRVSEVRVLDVYKVRERGLQDRRRRIQRSSSGHQQKHGGPASVRDQDLQEHVRPLRPQEDGDGNRRALPPPGPPQHRQIPGIRRPERKWPALDGHGVLRRRVCPRPAEGHEDSDGRVAHRLHRPLRAARAGLPPLQRHSPQGHQSRQHPAHDPRLRQAQRLRNLGASQAELRGARDGRLAPLDAPRGLQAPAGRPEGRPVVPGDHCDRARRGKAALPRPDARGAGTEGRRQERNADAAAQVEPGKGDAQGRLQGLEPAVPRLPRALFQKGPQGPPYRRNAADRPVYGRGAVQAHHVLQPPHERHAGRGHLRDEQRVQGGRRALRAGPQERAGAHLPQVAPVPHPLQELQRSGAARRDRVQDGQGRQQGRQGHRGLVHPQPPFRQRQGEGRGGAAPAQAQAEERRNHRLELHANPPQGHPGCRCCLLDETPGEVQAHSRRHGHFRRLRDRRRDPDAGARQGGPDSDKGLARHADARPGQRRPHGHQGAGQAARRRPRGAGGALRCGRQENRRQQRHVDAGAPRVSGARPRRRRPDADAADEGGPSRAVAGAQAATAA